MSFTLEALLKTVMTQEELICAYSGLPSVLSYLDDRATKDKDLPRFSENDLDRIIEMAWEDRTPFDAITFQFGLKEDEVKQVMKSHLKHSSYKRWRARVESRATKHAKKREVATQVFKCDRQRNISLNKISKRK